ncbi:glycosyltransferase family 2 protein [Pontibacter chitinilyticus]|uniref:glycosyltransferase family 2 protein n=1 Tax=Pontibacter chitinilyticus TaxID=2674989 RepID=UPI00321A0080
MQVNLSVVIITFNEEANIGRCLDSVQGVADEVVVVDSFSTDQTKALCLQRGVTFLEHPFSGHIEQKNYALTQAAFEYVLSLDADEALTDELKAAVLEAKNNWQADVYGMNRLTSYCGKWIRHGGWYPDRKLRLFDRRKVAWGGQNPHDTIIPVKGAVIAGVKGDLLHYSYTSIRQHLTQINNFTDSALQEMIQRGKRVSMLGLVLKPPFRFFRMYFLQLGLLDGFEGFCIAMLSSYAVFAKYAKLYMYNKYKEQDENDSDK